MLRIAGSSIPCDDACLLCMHGICSCCSGVAVGPLLACHCCSSVPSGRVGNSKDAIFRSNEHFRGAVAEREAAVSG